MNTRRHLTVRTLVPALVLAGLVACRNASTSARLRAAHEQAEPHLVELSRRNAAFEAHGTEEALQELPVVARSAGFQLRAGTRDGDTYFLIEPEPGAGTPGHLQSVEYLAWIDDDGDGVKGADEERLEQGGVRARPESDGERVSFGWWSEPVHPRIDRARLRVDIVVDGEEATFGVQPLN
jgi:hypothetical protein